MGSDRAAPPVSEEFIRRVLSDLVATESVNPGTPEIEMARRVRHWLEPTSATVNFVDTFPGRPSVAAVRRGTGSGRTLVLNGHMDTVAVDARDRWTAGPFEAEVRDGYLYGRGACDMKAGLAAQVAVAHALEGVDLRGELILQFAAGEERGEPGTLSLCEAGFVGDVGIVTEPTQLAVSVATRGLMTIRVRVLGVSAHASAVDAGHPNPVRHVPAVLAALADYELAVRARSHPLLGSGSCTPTVVQAGVQVNAVADFCDLYFDRRLIPGEEVEQELADVTHRLEALQRERPDFAYEVTIGEYPYAPAEVKADSALAKTVQDAAIRVLDRKPPIVGTAFASDVRNLINDAGMEAVTFGPGDVAECHCVDERVSLREVVEAADVLVQVALDTLR